MEVIPLLLLTGGERLGIMPGGPGGPREARSRDSFPNRMTARQKSLATGDAADPGAQTLDGIRGERGESMKLRVLGSHHQPPCPSSSHRVPPPATVSLLQPPCPTSSHRVPPPASVSLHSPRDGKTPLPSLLGCTEGPGTTLAMVLLGTRSG